VRVDDAFDGGPVGASEQRRLLDRAADDVGGCNAREVQNVRATVVTGMPSTVVVSRGASRWR